MVLLNLQIHNTINLIQLIKFKIQAGFKQTILLSFPQNPLSTFRLEGLDICGLWITNTCQIQF